MPVTGIGEKLRRERVRQGFTLEDIAQRTKIPIRSLDAIESEAFDRLPGLVFARNFVRLYSADLKLNAEDLLARLPRVDIDSTPMPDPPARQGRTKWDPRLAAAVASVLWLAAAGAAGTGAWYYYNYYGRHFVTTVAAAAPVSLPSAQAAPPPPEIPAAQSQATLTGAQAGDFDAGRPVQVILTAREVVWVQITADGRTAFVGTLHPNDTRTVAADAQVKILAGNAGGLDISLNGKPIDPIGPKGQIRTVRLTAEGPQFGPQTPTASSPL